MFRILTRWSWVALATTVLFAPAAQAARVSLEDLQTSINTLSNTVSTLQTKVTHLETENANLKAQVAALPAAPDLSDYVKIDDLPADISTLSTSVTTLNNKLACVSSTSTADELVLSGCNVRVVNGAGGTSAKNGKGNLIIGYNEEPTDWDISGGWMTAVERTGSHNLVVGIKHSYTATGGFLAGYHNSVTADFGSVSGGSDNLASREAASVSGGEHNIASSYRSSVSGGEHNIASGSFSSVSGGNNNTASGSFSSVSGGEDNIASAEVATVSGGRAITVATQYGVPPVSAVDLTGYVTTTALDTKLMPYAQKTDLPVLPDLSNYVTATSLGNTLSSYVERTALNTTLSDYAKIAGLSVYAKTTDLWS